MVSVNWQAFCEAAPELAAEAERLFEKTRVILIGTVRRDGGPRISPVEYTLLDGELYLGMMWRSLKGRDLARDPRCTIHSAVTDRQGADGEFKAHGRALDVREPERRERVGRFWYEVSGWRPDEPYHLFAIDVESAALFVTEEDARGVRRWRAGQPVRAYRQGIDGRLAPAD